MLWNKVGLSFYLFIILFLVKFTEVPEWIMNWPGDTNINFMAGRPGMQVGVDFSTEVWRPSHKFLLRHCEENNNMGELGSAESWSISSYGYSFRREQA